MKPKPDHDVPAGAAVFPLIPNELGVHPALLGLLHAVVFISGSDAKVIDAHAAEEALEYIATYLQRLKGRDLERIRSDVLALVEYARQEKWPKQEVEFIRDFLKNYGVGSAQYDG
jgi:hypothetical protein